MTQQDARSGAAAQLLLWRAGVNLPAACAPRPLLGPGKVTGSLQQLHIKPGEGPWEQVP